MMGENILIIGAGGHGSEIHSYIQDLTIQDNGLRLIGFIDEHKASGPWQGTEILGDLNVLKTLVGHQAEVNCLYITALGSNRLRREIVRKLDSLSLRNLSAWTLRHPDAVVGRRNEIGEGTCLAPSSIVTTNVHIGRHCILNVHASVSHDSVVGDFSNINPGATIAGNVMVGEGCFIGAGATVIEKITIGDWAVIGAGAVVIDDIPPGALAVGVPARVVKRGDEKGLAR